MIGEVEPIAKWSEHGQRQGQDLDKRAGNPSGRYGSSSPIKTPRRDSERWRSRLPPGLARGQSKTPAM